LAFLKGALERQKRRALHEKQGEGRQTEIRHRDIAAPPLRGSGKVAQTARKPARRDGKSSIPTVNHFSADLGFLKMRHF
jgi:hypothetical protein